ncbi:hypothetical protein BKA80DRAFT_286164, partial [Phyllosticta citrichinensis]
MVGRRKKERTKWREGSTSRRAELFEQSGWLEVTDQKADCAGWRAVHLARGVDVAHIRSGGG